MRDPERAYRMTFKLSAAQRRIVKRVLETASPVELKRRREPLTEAGDAPRI